MTTEPTTPTLRSLIAGGTSPLDVMPHGNDALGHLADALSNACGHREYRARRLQQLAEIRQAYRQFSDEDGEIATNVKAALFLDAWEEELLTNPELIEQVIALVPDPVDRLQLERRIQVATRGYPLEVELPEGTWSCDGCGGNFEADAPAVHVGIVDGETNTPDDHGYEPAWCVPCVEDLIERAKRLTT